MVTLTPSDRALLFELDRDARQPFSKIARTLRLNKETIRNRFELLKQRGVIAGTTVLCNIPKLGGLYVKVYLGFGAPSEREERRLLAFLERAPQVVWLVECFGRYDAIINGVFSDLSEFDRFTMRFMDEFGKCVERYDVSFLTDVRKLPRAYLSPKAVHNHPVVAPAAIPDVRDAAILAELCRDARLDSHAIGLRVGLTAAAVRHRIRALVARKVIANFTLNLNHSVFERSLVKLVVRLRHSSTARKNSFISYCAGLEGILYITCGKGVSDIDLDFEVLSLEGFNRLLRGMRRSNRDLMREYEILVISKEHKLDFSGAFLTLAGR
ncbi:MAG: AsnC family transcriptional regulator [Candidatus Micrarchaeota archaeon]